MAGKNEQGKATATFAHHPQIGFFVKLGIARQQDGIDKRAAMHERAAAELVATPEFLKLEMLLNERNVATAAKDKRTKQLRALENERAAVLADPSPGFVEKVLAVDEKIVAVEMVNDRASDLIEQMIDTADDELKRAADRIGDRLAGELLGECRRRMTELPDAIAERLTADPAALAALNELQDCIALESALLGHGADGPAVLAKGCGNAAFAKVIGDAGKQRKADRANRAQQGPAAIRLAG